MHCNTLYYIVIAKGITRALNVLRRYRTFGSFSSFFFFSRSKVKGKIVAKKSLYRVCGELSRVLNRKGFVFLSLFTKGIVLN